MRDEAHKVIIILMVVLMLVVASSIVVSSTSINAEKKYDKSFSEKITVLNSDIDWWPTFQHDMNHTGYSTSDAPETANLLWSYTFSDWGIEDSSPAVVDGKVYFGARNSQKVYCLDITNGHEIWAHTTGGWVDSSPTVVDGKVFVGSDDEKLYCLDANDGIELWTYTDTECGRIDCSPAVVDIDEDGVYEVFFTACPTYCLNAETGVKIWKNSNYETHSSPVVTDGDKDGDMEVYLGDGWIIGAFCLAADNGAVEWTSSYGGSSPTVTDGKIFVCSDGIHCLDIDDGTEIWSCLGAVDMGGTSVALWDNKVYASDDKVYCRAITDGSEIWSYTPDKSIKNSPIVADEKVYIGLGSIDGGKVVCLNAENGDEYTGFNSPSMGNVWATLAVADGKLFVGAGDMCCLGEEGDEMPTADFTWTPQNPKTDETVTFDASDSNDPDGSITKYEWDFDDDGGFDDATGKKPTHSWAKVGDYNVALKVTDDDDNTDTVTKKVTVQVNLLPSVKFIEPEKSLYLFNKKIRDFWLDFRKPYLIGEIEIKVDASDAQTNITKVEFYINDEATPRYVDYEAPYTWDWEPSNIWKHLLGKYTVKAVAYDNDTDEQRHNSAILEIKRPSPLVVAFGIILSAALVFSLLQSSEGS